MLRYIVSLMCVLLLLITTSFSQDTTETEEDLPPLSHTPGKFGGGVGFTPSLFYMDLNPMNEVLRTSNAAELSGGPLYLAGGHVYGYFLFVQNLRGGVMWESGSKSSLVTSNGITRGVEFKVGFTGATVEYVIPLHPRLDFTIGTVLGGGWMNIIMKRDNNTQTRSWDSTWTEFGRSNPVPEFSRELSGSFFVYEPTVNLEYAVLRWLGVRVGAGYLGMVGNSWKLDDKYDVPDVPDNIKGKGLMINAGVFIGTFIF